MHSILRERTLAGSEAGQLQYNSLKTGRKGPSGLSCYSPVAFKAGLEKDEWVKPALELRSTLLVSPSLSQFLNYFLSHY